MGSKRHCGVPRDAVAFRVAPAIVREPAFLSTGLANSEPRLLSCARGRARRRGPAMNKDGNAFETGTVERNIRGPGVRDRHGRAHAHRRPLDSGELVGRGARGGGIVGNRVARVGAPPPAAPLLVLGRHSLALRRAARGHRNRECWESPSGISRSLARREGAARGGEHLQTRRGPRHRAAVRPSAELARNLASLYPPPRSASWRRSDSSSSRPPIFCGISRTSPLCSPACGSPGSSSSPISGSRGTRWRRRAS